MREIKFRVFCNKHNKWEYYTLGDLICGSTTESNREGGMYKSITWGQYTGLSDKNGKEIYEGDIIRGTFPNYEFDNENENSPLFLSKESIVEYREHGFWIKDEYFGWEGEGLWNWEDSEVIGNIHENPELL